MAAGVIQKQETVLANDAIDNLVAGSAFEYLRGNTFLSMGIVQAVTGCFVTVQIGSNILVEEFEPEIEATDFPRTDSQFYYNAFGVAGDRIVIRVRNSTGGNIVARTIVQLTDV